MKELRTVDEITAWLNEAAGLSEALLEDLLSPTMATRSISGSS